MEPTTFRHDRRQHRSRRQGGVRRRRLVPLALYVRAVALNESAGGPGLAAAARAWAALSAALAGRTEAAAAAFLETVAGEGAVADFGVGPEIPAAARRI